MCEPREARSGVHHTFQSSLRPPTYLKGAVYQITALIKASNTTQTCTQLGGKSEKAGN